ncbi:MAG: GspH/FimT family pseudopilin [Henriciella sp.]|nr:GspH/FimT family pseudopilin [Henriciella sp.]
MTLIEVMMVVFIIGLMTGLVVLTLPPRASAEQQAARAFAQVLTQAQDQAVLSGQPVGIILKDDHYTVRIWRAERWEYMRGGAQLERGVKLRMDRVRGVETPEGWPDLVFDPTGVSDGASFRLRGRNEQITLTLDASGEVQLETQ